MPLSRTVQYKMFRGTLASWDELFANAAEFATQLGPGRLICISHSEDKDDGVVAVWYWDEPAQPAVDRVAQTRSMNLGAFSVSLTVKDLAASRSFYEKFGFRVFAGDASQNWLIMKNGGHVIGLFQGMFERNILTFNPGWDQNAQPLAQFTDVRELQRQLRARGVQLQQQADESTTGPASFIAVDPDGNPILVDQHV